jgi:hypothetical protein
MIDHPSVLELDEVVAGLSNGRAAAHLEACLSCQARLDELAAKRKTVMDSPGFQQAFAKLPAARPAFRPRRLFWAGAAVLAAAALFLVARPAHELRAKGSASIEILNSAGRESLAPRVGEQVELRLGAGQYTYALAVGIDQAGATTRLWPSDEMHSALSPGTHASVQLRVTPGPVRIVGVFSNRPLSINDAIERQARPDVEYVEREIRPVP